jgi:hypothetical protein
LNPAAFTAAPLLYPSQCESDSNFCVTGFGDLGRNIYRGPAEQNWDASVIKYFRVGEHQEVRFTADFFNVWNHPTFGNPAVTDIEAGTPFGQIVNSTGTPRLIQFSLRLAF